MLAEDLKLYEGKHVCITLVDGSRVKGYLRGVGYSGVTLMSRHAGVDIRRCSYIKSIKERKRRWWSA